jgi:hypothetical protein
MHRRLSDAQKAKLKFIQVHARAYRSEITRGFHSLSRVLALEADDRGLGGTRQAEQVLHHKPPTVNTLTLLKRPLVVNGTKVISAGLGQSAGRLGT